MRPCRPGTACASTLYERPRAEVPPRTRRRLKQKGTVLDRNLENGQSVAIRVAMGPQEEEFPAVVRSCDPAQGLICVKIEGGSKEMASAFLGKKATIVGRTPDVNLDLPCIVAPESHFPILVCQRVNRRNHVRVNAFLPLTFRPVDRSLYETDPEGVLVRLQEELGAHEGAYETVQEEEEGEPIHPKMVALLTDMNRKLDRILAALQREQDGQPQGPMSVNISGSGFRFTVRERIEAKALLAVRTVLPLSPPATIVFIGEVTRVRDKGGGQFEIAVRFLAIDENDRDQIVHYTFKRMRESVRNRNRQTAQA